MPQPASSLDRIRLASPCTVSWDSMTGDDKVRHCGQCRLNVYNLSELSVTEADALIREKEGRLCAWFYKRADGTILTRDCPEGLAAAKRRIARLGGIAAAMALIPGLIGCGGTWGPEPLPPPPKAVEAPASPADPDAEKKGDASNAPAVDAKPK